MPRARLHSGLSRRGRSQLTKAAIVVSLSLVGVAASRVAVAQAPDAPAPAPSGSIGAAASAEAEPAPPPTSSAPPVPPPLTAAEIGTPVQPPPDATNAASTDVSTTAKTEDERLAGVPDDLGRLILDDGRHPFLKKPKAGFLQIEAHGELQLRYENLSRLRLTPPVSDPGLQFLGQRNYALTWLRVGAQALVGESVKLVFQMDLVPRWIVGDLTQGVSAAGDHARNEHVPTFVRLRYAYLDWLTPIGLLRVGQTGNNWGMGILANNGDRPMLFGDYRFGSLVERIAFATRPFGKQSPFVVAVAGDAVLQDANSKWSAGDRTYQAIFSAFYEKEQNQIGFFGVRRWQNTRPEVGAGDERRSLYVWVADFAGKGAVQIADDTFAFGAFEVATIFGKTDAIRSTPEFNEQTVRSWGGAAQLGIVKRAKGTTGGDPRSYGRIVAQLEGGYASGDANPYDGVIKRFTFDPNHQVGLLMFPFVLHFHTARSATNASDPNLVARPLAGSRFLASNGGVFGASYLNPIVVFRPIPSLDLKGGAVFAVSSSDVVDPYRTAIGGDQAYNGGSPKSRDLGIELDGGFEWRVRVPGPVTLQLGAQAGVFFPGRAFDDAKGNRAKPQSIVQGRLGVQF